jgi:hypothetical protein
MRAMLVMSTSMMVLFVVLLVPGAALSIAGSRRWPQLVQIGLAPVMVLSALVHFIAFFAWYRSPLWGRGFSICVLSISVGIFLTRQGRAAIAGWFKDRDVRSPLLLALGVALAVFGSLLLHGGGAHPTDVAAERWLLLRLPPDNVLPAMLADRVVRDIPVEPFFDGWKSSDRPPLQAGAVAFAEPLRIGMSFEQQYQVVSTDLATWSLLGLWVFLRRLRIRRNPCAAALLMAAASGNVVLNSAFVWPKLLSAGLAFVALSLALPDTAIPDRPTSIGTGWRLRSVFGGAAVSLSLLAHGASMFAFAPVLLGTPVVWLIARHTRTVGWSANLTLRRSALAGLVSVGVLVPWLVYQRTVAPPGDRLLAWHLGGILTIPTKPWYRMTIDHYRSIGWAGAMKNRYENVRVLSNPHHLFDQAFAVRGTWVNVRVNEFYRVFNGVNLAWIGIGLLLAVVLVPRARQRHEAVVGASLLAYCAWGLIVWVAIAFGPGATTPHQGTAVVQLLLLAGPSLIMSSIHRWVGWAVSLAASLRVIVVWLLAGDSKRPNVSSTSLLILIIGLAFVAIATLDATLDATLGAVRSGRLRESRAERAKL